MARIPLTPRSEGPFESLDAVILQCIGHHVGRPCPTTREIREWTGMPRRKVWPYIEGMTQRGKIEIQIQESRGEGKDPKRRRLRARGGDWTDWTARMPDHPCRDKCGRFKPVDTK